MDAATTTASISDRLAGRSVLLTGATGFLGKAVLGLLLEEAPALRRVTVLVRADDDEAARRRVEADVASSPAASAAADALRDGRVVALAGDVAEDGVGREAGDPALGDVDVVIHCAASVSFEQPLDEILALNAQGPVRLLRALREAGSDPYVVQVSTAYAAGQRTGLVLERPSGTAPAEPALDLEAELAAARDWRRALEAESRLPRHQRRFAAEAAREVGPAGGPAIGARAEAERRAWVSSQLTERGRERARTLGWADGYALSKAFSERLLQAERPRALTILRPSIIESALERPHPGWLEALKVADPVILAYATGMVSRFPATPDARLDLVPVDLVAGLCVVAAASPPVDGVRTVHVVSGARNPVSVQRVADVVTAYFRERPLPGEGGAPVEVAEWRFAGRRRVLGTLAHAQRAVRGGRSLLERVPLPRSDRLELRLHREQRRLGRLERLAEIYGPYVELDCVFDDRAAQELLAGVERADRERMLLDVEEIDWEHYLANVHLPALRALVPTPRPSGRRPAPRRPAPAEGPPALAIFDVEGVVLDTTIAHFYAWLRTRDMPWLDRLLWSAGTAARAPGWLAADRRSRAAFNRRFYRVYEDLPAAELRAQAEGALSDFILPRMQNEAVRRIRAHRRRGDRVVLVTGALDFLVEPLRHLADELVAARLVEQRGRFTGELALPPLTADGRASLAARLAAEHGVAPEDCHAYADSVADLPLLETVGHPHVVNPDFRLAREARRRGWPVESWAAEGIPVGAGA